MNINSTGRYSLRYLGSETTLQTLNEIQKECFDNTEFMVCSVHHTSEIARECGGDVTFILIDSIVGLIVGSKKIGVFRASWQNIKWLSLPSI